MQSKLFALLLVAVVLTSAFTVSIMPTVNALTSRTDFNDRHLTASFGNSPICGDHKCGPGEKTQWMAKMAQLQRVGAGKLDSAANFEDVLKNIQSNSTSSPTSKNSTMTEIHMGENVTSMSNMTQSTK